MLVDDILKHLVTGTNCMQINAYLVEERGPKILFSLLRILEQNTLENNSRHSFLTEKNNVNYDLPASCKASLLKVQTRALMWVRYIITDD